jgi:hypothetical protein
MKYKIILTVETVFDVPRELTSLEQETLRNNVEYDASKLSELWYSLDNMIGPSWDSKETLTVTCHEIP